MSCFQTLRVSYGQCQFLSSQCCFSDRYGTAATCTNCQVTATESREGKTFFLEQLLLYVSVILSDHKFKKGRIHLVSDTTIAHFIYAPRTIYYNKADSMSPITSSAQCRLLSLILFALLCGLIFTEYFLKDFSPTPVGSVIVTRANNISSDDPWGDLTIRSAGSLFSNSLFLKFTSLDNGDGSLGILANNPETRPKEWVALGDSFAAGPGAGAPYGQDCKRGQNAYPPQMQNDPDMRGPDPPAMPSKPRFNFKACTGDVTQDLTDEHNPNYQLGAVSESTSFLTLSIGGNDVKFSDILQRCVYGLGTGPGTCDEFIEIARAQLYSRKMYNNYNNVLNKALEKLAFERRWVSRKRTALYQTGYPQFFDSFTTQCNTVTFLYGLAGPKMTQELRRNLNRLTHEVNYVLQYWMDNLNVHHTTQRIGDVRYSTAFDWVDQDLMYTDHRFCRSNVREPDRKNPATWFFHLRFPAPADSASATDNTVAANIDEFNRTFTWEGVSANTAPMWVTKTFHPTSAGFRETKNLMMFKLHYDLALRAFTGTSANIMVVGDVVAVGSYNPQSETYQGFRGHLKSILEDHRLYLGEGMRHTFIGSQSAEYLGYLEHECYADADLAGLYDHLKASPDISLQRKVVLLMAGTRDMLYGEDLANAPVRLVKIIDLIFDKDPLAVVIVGQIPMIGLEEDGATFFDMQRRVASYNAAIAAIVNRMVQEKGRHILKVHTTTTTWEHQEGSFVTPNGPGYLRMAYDFLEGIALANVYGWLNVRQTFTGTATPVPNGRAVVAGSTSTPSTSSAAIGFNFSAPTKTVVCSQARPTAAPDFNTITKTVFGGLSQLDFVTKVACNETAVCGNSPNSNVNIVRPSFSGQCALTLFETISIRF